MRSEFRVLSPAKSRDWGLDHSGPAGEALHSDPEL